MMYLVFKWLLVANAQNPTPEDSKPPAAPATNTAEPAYSKMPSVTYAAPVNYPPQALKEGRKALIKMALLIDEKGTVKQARVLEEVGYGFDQAAIDAALNYKFTPALDQQGQPSAIEILFRLSFQPKKAPPVTAKGKVQQAGIRKPLVGIRVIGVGPNGQQAFSRTNEQGEFQFNGLTDGKWIFAVKSSVYRTKTQAATISSQKVSELSFYLIPERSKLSKRLSKEVVVSGSRDSSDVTTRKLTTEEIQFLPGSGGDVVKAIQNLPGIGRAPLGIGQLIIRGTAPEDSTFYIDGGNIPDVFHFGGLTTVVNADSIEEVLYLPGNYSVRYGRQLGGLVDIRTRTRLPERDRGYLAVDIYQSTLFTEQKINEKWGLSFSARRSYADFILNPILSNSDITVRAPRYYDLQLRTLYRPNSSNIFDALFFLSDDQFRFLGQNQDGEQQTAASFSKNFQKVRLKWQKDLTKGWKQDMVLVSGPERQDFEFQVTGIAYEQTIGVNFREEFYRNIEYNDKTAWKFGLDLYTGQFNYNYDVPTYPGDGEKDSFFFLSPALYVENTYRLGRFDIISGVRTEGYTLDNEICVPALDPRLVTKFRATDNLLLKAGSGLFSQFPLPRELSPRSDGNPDLVAEKALQNTIGFEQKIGDGFTLDSSIFYNLLYELVLGREDRFQFFTGPPPIGPFDTDPYGNVGTGRIIGLESQLRYTSDNTLGLIAATFSRSERDTRDGELELFTYDQPIVINALYSRILPRNWRLGSRIRYSSGYPYTPVINRIYDLNSREFIPIYGDRDSSRLPSFFSLDIRIDKEVIYRKWTLTYYLDVQNVTNAKNVEVQSWAYDYSEPQPIQGNPPFPAFGIKGEW